MGGLFLALLAEGLLLLVVLAFGSSIAQRETRAPSLAVVEMKGASGRTPAPTPEKEDQPARRKAERAPPTTTEPRPDEPRTAQPEPAAAQQPLIRLSTADMAAADIAAMPRQAAAPRRSPMGPPDTGTALRDTARVEGAGPNGEPLYAAAWYREPYDDELSGYLATATGPGWGLIACRTAPDYRVEDCVMIDEHPSGSRIARAVLAAAWQFRVRPPRLGGQPRIGEWVRIRIDYDYRRK